MAVTIYLIQFLGLVCTILELTNKTKRPVLLYILATVTTLVALTLIVSENGVDVFKALSIGGYLTLVASVGCTAGLLMGGFNRRERPDRSAAANTPSTDLSK